MERHITLTCKNRLSICKNLDCQFVSNNTDQIDEHYQNCVYSLLSCPICKRIFKKKDEHNCAEFFITKLNSTQEIFRSLTEEYSVKLKELEDMTEYVNKQILLGITNK